MAERRMFAKSVVCSDHFMSMTVRSKVLYFYLGIYADDDGFVGGPKSILRGLQLSQKDLQQLADKGYVRCFPSGVVWITHWHINNLIRKDRYRPTIYTKEKKQVDAMLRRKSKAAERLTDGQPAVDPV